MPSYLATPIANAARWLVLSREISNFTYDLTPLNCRVLAAFIGHVASIPYNQAFSYVCEPASTRNSLTTFVPQQ